MGGHALTPPTDRRLGVPLPLQLANQTHNHLKPTFAFLNSKMPRRYIMRDYSSFPMTFPQFKVDSVRVTHPCATRSIAETVRLACIRPAASVHPEPGSNSSFYFCSLYCKGCFFLLSSIFLASLSFNLTFFFFGLATKATAKVRRLFYSTKFIFKKLQKNLFFFDFFVFYWFVVSRCFCIASAKVRPVFIPPNYF